MNRNGGYTALREPPRELPSNFDAEQALLGALLCDNRAFARIAEIVRLGDFVWAVHQRIFDAITKLIREGVEASLITLRHLFDNDPDLQPHRGGTYLAKLAVSAVTVSNAPDYALIITDLALRRDLIADLYELKPNETALGMLSTHRPRIEALAKAARDLAPARRRVNAG